MSDGDKRDDPKYLFVRLCWLLADREKEETPERKALYYDAIQEPMGKLLEAAREP